jgi:hypothetical protein
MGMTRMILVVVLLSLKGLVVLGLVDIRFHSFSRVGEVVDSLVVEDSSSTLIVMVEVDGEDISYRIRGWINMAEAYLSIVLFCKPSTRF